MEFSGLSLTDRQPLVQRLPSHLSCPPWRFPFLITESVDLSSAKKGHQSCAVLLTPARQKGYPRTRNPTQMPPMAYFPLPQQNRKPTEPPTFIHLIHFYIHTVPRPKLPETLQALRLPRPTIATENPLIPRSSINWLALKTTYRWFAIRKRLELSLLQLLHA